MLSFRNRSPLIFLGIFSLVLSTFAGSSARALPNPEAPSVEVTGTPGKVQAAYWVIADSGVPLPGNPSHYTGEFRTQVTALSPPAVITLPDNLGRGGSVRISVKPVPGAKRYLILKTVQLPAPHAKVTVKKSGNGNLYYWAVAYNAWRRSPLAGPFPALHTDPEKPENEIEVTPVPDATAYSYYVTPTPEPPVGRDYYGVAELVGPKITHTGGAAHVPVGFPPTLANEPPYGLGNFLLAVTDGKPVEDTGQPLQQFLPPGINETDTRPLELSPDMVGFSRNPLNSLLSLRPQAPAHLAPEPSFAWTGFYPLWMDTFVESGGIQPLPDASRRGRGL